MTLNSQSVSFTAVALPDIPLIQKDDSLVQIILDSLKRAGIALESSDVLVISSKIVSKAEGRIVDLRDVVPRPEAVSLAQETDKDPRVVELVLQESDHISRKTKGVLVTKHRLGFVSANAGLDQSNVDDTGHNILLLPRDPDASARQIQAGIMTATGINPSIVISDTHGRPFRNGNVGVAIGVAGIPAVLDLRGQKDLFGRELQASEQGYGDLVASAAHLLCGEGGEGRPVVLLRGLSYPVSEGTARDLNRDPERDLYR